MDNSPPQSPSPARTKASSPKFPQISLQSAIEKAKLVWEAEGKHACRVNALAQHWGTTETSSMVRTLIGALMHFGLFDKVGQLEAAEYKLSTLALQILLGSDEEKARALQKAVMEPRLYKEIWTKFEGNLPSDANLLNRLILDYNLNRESAPRFIKDFRESLTLARLDKVAEDGGQHEQPLAPKPTESGNEHPKSTPVAEPGRQAPAPPPPATLQGSVRKQIDIKPPMNPTLRYLPIPLDIGDAPIPVGMSEDDFNLLLETLQLWKRKIVKPTSRSWNDIPPAQQDAPVPDEEEI